MAQRDHTSSVVVGQGIQRQVGAGMAVLGMEPLLGGVSMVVTGGGGMRHGCKRGDGRDSLGSVRGAGGGPSARKRTRERSDRTASPTVATWWRAILFFDLGNRYG